MSAVVVTADIARSPDEVFAYVTDASRFAEWQQDASNVQVEGNPHSVGTRYRTTRRIGSVRRTTIRTSEVVECTPPRRWVARGIDGPVRSVVAIGVEPLDGGARSRVTIGLDFSGHGIGKLLIPLVLRQARREAPDNRRALRERLEGLSSGRPGTPAS